MPTRLNLRHSARRLAGVFLLVPLLALVLPGCALIIPQTTELRDARPTALPERAELSSVPFFPQADYQCGPAALATILADLDVPVTPDDLAGQVYLPARQGSLQVEMLAAPRRYGLVSYQLSPRFEDVLREVAAGTPVIVLQNYGIRFMPLWHYAVVAGYDYRRGEVVLRSGVKDRLVMPLGILEYTWKESGYWAMVVLPPGRLPATADESRYLAAINAMARVGDSAAAAGAYAAFLGRWPDNATAAIGLAGAHYMRGQLGEAEAVLRRAAEAHPDSAIVLNNLAQTLSDQGRQDEALHVVERAAALKGPFATAVDETRSTILRRRSRAPD